MHISNLLKKLTNFIIIGNQQTDIQNLSADSRNINTATLFFAIKGSHSDGHQFILNSLNKGAAAIVCEYVEDSWAKMFAKAVFIQVKDSSFAMGLIASNFYNEPSANMQVVGTTGTNGKTTTSSLLYQLFTKLGYVCGLISTVEYKIANQSFISTHTTPDALILQKLLANMRNAGCQYVFMEVSSHSVHQQRIAGVQFAGAIFTNLSHDHLDYHLTFQNYINAKKMFFDNLPKTAFALVNIDDKRGEVMLQNTKAQQFRYGIKTFCDFKAKLLENSLTGLHLELDNTEFYSPLIGDFNAYNLLAVYAAAILLKADKIEVLTQLSTLQTVKGRFELVKYPNKNITGIVDYAHTPDALEKVLQTINKISSQNNIITVVGCGGDRDKSKRPIMAKIAYDYSGTLILTSDNPRTENPETILKEMEAGLFGLEKQHYMIIPDRKKAIEKACQLAQSDFVILIAGKGHETYQEINNERFNFDDKLILEQYLAIKN